MWHHYKIYGKSAQSRTVWSIEFKRRVETILAACAMAAAESAFDAFAMGETDWRKIMGRAGIAAVGGARLYLMIPTSRETVPPPTNPTPFPRMK